MVSERSPTPRSSSDVSVSADPTIHEETVQTLDDEKRECSNNSAGSKSSSGSPDHLEKPPPAHILSHSHSTQTLSRSITEVRDGFPNARDLERGEEEEEKQPDQDPNDPNLVTWDGPEDPQNPKFWQLKRKWAAVVCCKPPP